MKNLIHLVREIPKKVKNIGKGIGFGILGASICYSTMSCATMTEAQKITMAGNALMLSSQYSNNSKDARNAAAAGSLLTTYGQMQHEIEVAEAGKNQIIVNNNPNNNQGQQQSQVYKNTPNNSPRVIVIRETHPRIKQTYPRNKAPRGIFTYSKWMDFNGNGAMEGKELLGFNPINFNKDPLTHLAYNPGKSSHNGKYTLKIWNLGKGKLIYNHNFTYKYPYIKILYLNNVVNGNEGKYKAIITTEKNKNFSLDFKVIK